MSTSRISGIYQIRNVVSGKVYVGSGINAYARWRLHRSLLNRRMHHSILLQRAWNKYGEGAFSFEIVEIVERKELLVPREQHHLDAALATGQHYNYSPTAGSMLGHKHTAATRAKMSLAKKGKPLSAEICARRSLRMKGTPFPVARHPHLARVNTRNTGKPCSVETRSKISVGNRGKKRSAEHCKKMSLLNTGKGCSIGQREKVSPLNAQQVLEIRKTMTSYSSIARCYGVCHETISRIKNRKTWKHLPG